METSLVMNSLVLSKICALGFAVVTRAFSKCFMWGGRECTGFKPFSVAGGTD